MKSYLYFDSAATTPCNEESLKESKTYWEECYGNPSSTYCLGVDAAKPIEEAKKFFSSIFGITPAQVIFTGSGTEADNLALYGPCMAELALRNQSNSSQPHSQTAALPKKNPNIVVSAIEHPAVSKTAQSLKEIGFELRTVPINSQGQVTAQELLKQVDANTLVVSIMSVNNIMGAIQPIEELAQAVKAHFPNVIFHTDAIQAFGKIPLPQHPSPVDLISVSAHKIEGPKGIGALLILNPLLLSQEKMRPLIWGGGQEGGWRSGTQSPALIAGFHASARKTQKQLSQAYKHTQMLNFEFRKKLQELGLLEPQGAVFWNSPDSAVPHIISLSIPGYSSKLIAKNLEQLGCLISTGSACSSSKTIMDPSLGALGISNERIQSSIRISLSHHHQVADIHALSEALKKAIEKIQLLMTSA